MQRQRILMLSATTFMLLAVIGIGCGPANAGAAVGDAAPAFQLTGADGKTYSLADLKGKTVVLEWINPNCPFSVRHADEKTMVETAGKHSEVVWLAVNSTRQGHSDYLEPAAHLAYNKTKGIDYPVLYDSSGTVGHAYDARTTPHMFIIDEQGKLIYNGAIDNDPSGRTGKTERVNYVDTGLAAHAGGKAPEPSTTKPYGCSVKY
jgi:alkyl hydroperoxide reductase subunit AhpC